MPLFFQATCSCSFLLNRQSTGAYLVVNQRTAQVPGDRGLVLL